MRPLLVALLFPLPALAPTKIFTDVTAQAGITWKQFNGESPERYLLETTTGGVAFLDFDNDGLLDIFFVNGGETPSEKPQHILVVIEGVQSDGKGVVAAVPIARE